MTATKQKETAKNGTGPTNGLAEAIAHEEAIREAADFIWAGADQSEPGHAPDTLDPPLFRKLRPLIRKPIPSGFIEHVGEVSGKPYESTGVKSVQVQIDRLDNVLGPENWGYTAEYSQDGKLCYVTAWVGPKDSPLFTRDSWGGVRAGTGEGNIRKGAFTNAAKLAFARLGPGWEVYVGAADFDPDTDKAAAEQQANTQDAPPPVDTIDSERVAELVTTYQNRKSAAEDGDKFAKTVKVKLGSMGVPTPSINRAFAALTPAQADEIEAWLAEPKGGES